MMRLLTLLLLGILYPATLARSENRFRRPPGPGPTGDYRDNPVYTLGDEIDLQWETSFKAVDVVLWQQQPKGNTKPAFSRLAVNSKAKSLVWTVGYAGFPSNHDPELSPVYFVQLFKTGETTGNVTSHYFNITKPVSTTSFSSSSVSRTLSLQTSSTTSTPSTTTPATLALGPAITTSSPSPSTTTMTTTTPASEDRLSSGTVAGIAVGATLGAILVLVLAAWVVVRRRVLRRKMAVHTQSDIVQYAARQLREKDGVFTVDTESRECFEVEAPGTRHEMAAEPVELEDRRGRL
ncbi:hypothetical protein CH63R_13076 [Colletotrichum higginsianum IMI 349063]|uniref:Uncharacterized protein n=2 Tax=Colletotrichum higginsianum TaxID=80884 RepID=A0A1B7XVZ0_COLHI|nr:hypothetical protein CH63R_13076 [Colletotrichum higginsianum IMI 349063]OBR03949.1 hypothetical protein CH63R_13076 [Colletotrichum higginsianum IMI 349063]TIC90149.1 hypothetical protein CH35J_011957 [Colletotrichum higginsianum]